MLKNRIPPKHNQGMQPDKVRYRGYWGSGEGRLSSRKITQAAPYMHDIDSAGTKPTRREGKQKGTASRRVPELMFWKCRVTKKTTSQIGKWQQLCESSKQQRDALHWKTWEILTANEISGCEIVPKLKLRKPQRHCHLKKDCKMHSEHTTQP